MITPLIRRVSVTAAALFSVLTLTVTQAGAADKAYNERIMYLTDNPTSANVACESRDIYLTAGNYEWMQLHNDMYAMAREIWLVAGWYKMQDCLNGVYQDGGGYYKHTSYLVPPAGVGATATIQSNWNLPYSASYQWASTLEHL